MTRKTILPDCPYTIISNSSYIVGHERPMMLVSGGIYEIKFLSDVDTCVIYLDNKVELASWKYNFKKRIKIIIYSRNIQPSWL